MRRTFWLVTAVLLTTIGMAWIGHRRFRGGSESVGLAAVSQVESGGTLPDPVDSLAARLNAGRAVIASVRFIGATDSLEASAEVALERLAGVLGAMSGSFLIEAHVSPGGDVLAEQALSDRQAARVREHLVAAGIPPPRLFSMGFGATHPPRANGTPAARVEVSRMP